MPRRHGVLDVGIGKIECPALECRNEIAEPRHDDMPDFCLGDDGLELVGEILHNNDDVGTGIAELFLQLTRRVERVDVDRDQSCTQHAEKRYRISKHVRQHDRDAAAGMALHLLDQERRESAAVALPLGIAHLGAEAFKCRTSGMPIARLNEHCMKRRHTIRIDGHRNAWRVRGEPVGIHGLYRRRRRLSL